MNTVTISLPSILELDINNINLTDEHFFQLCQNNPNQEVEIFESPQTLSGENVLPGFVLDLSEIW